VALNDAGSERILWDDDFDIERNPDRILSTQREIALRVATTIGAQILPAERNRLDVDPPTSVEAFDLYMEGLYHLRGVTLGAGDLDRAVEALESATTVDPMWPPAHAALGAALHWLGTSGVPGSAAILQRSRAESEQALALDSAYAPAWASLGFALAVGDRDFPAADAAYREAARLGGAEPRGHAFVLRLAGRWEEALGMYARAIAQDPRSTVLLANAGHAHFCSRDYRGAIDLYERARNIRPEAVASDVRPALAQLELGLTDEASAEADRLWSNRGANNVRAESLALLYARLGSTTRAEELLDESDRQTRLKEFAFGAAAALELDDPERALDYIEQLGMQRRAADQLLCLDFSAVAHDERFREALRRGGVAAGAEYSGRAP
jgi:tetratricopeptide (TPR) repeat protein